MAKKQMSWKTKGMNRDLSPSAFNPEFAFENRNLRLGTNEGNTMMSWVTERGTLAIRIVIGNWIEGDDTTRTKVTSITGTPIGTAVINHKLVIFTTDTLHDQDYIFVLKYADTEKTTMLCRQLFGGENLSLNFDIDHPLETLVSYESEKIQKVYWVDGINQPRVINIEGSIRDNNTTQFDFVPTLQLLEDVSVQKMLGANGMFAPGVIQYAFTYYTKYGQESNIFYVTPLQYISFRDRGASPEEKVENAFRITVTGVDMNFDYLRIYSIQRTSVNATPICKRVHDINIQDYHEDQDTTNITDVDYPLMYTNGNHQEKAYSPHTVNASIGKVTSVVTWDVYYKNMYSDLRVITSNGHEFTWSLSSTNSSVVFVSKNKVEEFDKYFIYECPNNGSFVPRSMTPLTEASSSVSFIDTGTGGESIDPMELLYKGGEVTSAYTLEAKDNTLFLGNINITREQIDDSLKKELAAHTLVHQGYRDITPLPISEGSYVYANQLNSTDSTGENSKPCNGFKYGDIYRLGMQFQYKTGKWSDPVFINDEKVTNKPLQSLDNTTIKLPILKGTIKSSEVAKLVSLGYKRARALVVFPSIQDRNVLCQGVVNTTLFTQEHRNNGDLYAQSSWFFRPTRPIGQGAVDSNGAVCPADGSGYLPYTHRGTGAGVPFPNDHRYDPLEPDNNIRRVEVQGDYTENNKFQMDKSILTFHSPDIEFDTQMSLVDYGDTKYRYSGYASFLGTMSDIEIQTETPTASSNGAGFIHKSFKESQTYGIVSGLFYEDYLIDDGEEIVSHKDEKSPVKWHVYLWNKNGSLNNDFSRPANKGTATAVLKKKVISNLRYSNTVFESTDDGKQYNELHTFKPAPQLFSSNEDTIVRLENNIYEGNIDSLIVSDNADGNYFVFPAGRIANQQQSIIPFASNTYWWKTGLAKNGDAGQLFVYSEVRKEWSQVPDEPIGDIYLDSAAKKCQVRIKYKSTPHLVFGPEKDAPIWSGGEGATLPILEVVQNPIDSKRFGGRSSDALKENIWLPCGEPQLLTNLNENGDVEIAWEYGDTYFQRWDCLKTYPFTFEDPNQVVEIGSFMLETHVNIEGRYDRNRGQKNNLNMSPINFNLLNTVYSQQDNFFSYRIQDDYQASGNKFPNQITWSKTKESGADVDLWTNMTLASTLELDGNKGEITKLHRLNNSLLCFQNSGLSQILYKENMMLSTTEGVPVEIGNSDKVQGKTYISDTVGCADKWSIVSGTMGLYFMDSNSRDIYVFNGQLQNLSVAKGFNAWSKMYIPSADFKWTPLFKETNEKSAFVSYYDKMNQEILFINNRRCLAYSEKFGVFTSFYDYNNTPFFASLDDTGIWLRANQLWKHQSGEYCRFFGASRPYSMILVGNQEPQTDKIFTNVEFRACVAGDGVLSGERFTPYLPFDSLDTWNEYQHGVAYLDNMRGHSAYKHHTLDNEASLKRKFRIWRCDIPRDNGDNQDTFDETFDETFHPLARLQKHPLDRMRNPWLYLRLRKSMEEHPKRAEIHDIVMTYFN